MNVRIENSYEFIAGAVFPESHEALFMNQYFVTLSMMTDSMNPVEHNIALGRVNHLINNVLNSSVMIQSDCLDEIEKLQNAGLRIVTLPVDPYDQVIGLMLYSKLNAIMEGRVIITDIVVSSTLGQHLRYCHAAEEGIGPFDAAGWWTDPNPTHNDKKVTSNKKIVKINKQTHWKDFGLSWDSASDSGVEQTVVVKFDTDEQK